VVLHKQSVGDFGQKRDLLGGTFVKTWALAFTPMFIPPYSLSMLLVKYFAGSMLMRIDQNTSQPVTNELRRCAKQHQNNTLGSKP
jgi:hypothetical protein